MNFLSRNVKIRHFCSEKMILGQLRIGESPAISAALLWAELHCWSGTWPTWCHLSHWSGQHCLLSTDCGYRQLGVTHLIDLDIAVGQLGMKTEERRGDRRHPAHVITNLVPSTSLSLDIAWWQFINAQMQFSCSQSCWVCWQLGNMQKWLIDDYWQQVPLTID